MTEKNTNIHILYEDSDLIAVNKQAGMLAQNDNTGRESLSENIIRRIGKNEDGTGEIYLGPVHRLDRPVSGVMIFAKTTIAARRLSDQFKDRKMKKVYCALVPSNLNSGNDITGWNNLSQYLARRRDKAYIVDADHPKAENVTLSYRVILRSAGYSLLLIELGTGKRHQIRVQLASQGMPITGDWTYGSKEKIDGGTICLHSVYLRFTHPGLNTPMEITAPFPQHILERLDKPIGIEDLLDIIHQPGTF